jgi:hypothetical protein
MIPTQQLEAYLCSQIRKANFDASRTQVVPATAVDEDRLTLPRIVVEATAGQDAVMNQIGVYPMQVAATLICNAREPLDAYLLDPLQEAVVSVLRAPGVVGTSTVQETAILPTGNMIPTGNMVVSGAGSAAANGTYAPVAQNLGDGTKQEYGVGDKSIYWDLDSWYIHAAGNDLYEAAHNTTTPDLVPVWWPIGLLPAPTVTAETEPELGPQTTTREILTNPAAEFGVAIYGATLGDLTTTQAEDRIEVVVSATLHAQATI